MDAKHCSGCYNNFYNGEGAEKCWSLATAKLILRKEVPGHQVPPWKQKARKLPSCYQRPHYWYVEPDRER